MRSLIPFCCLMFSVLCSLFLFSNVCTMITQDQSQHAVFSLCSLEPSRFRQKSNRIRSTVKRISKWVAKLANSSGKTNHGDNGSQDCAEYISAERISVPETWEAGSLRGQNRANSAHFQSFCGYLYVCCEAHPDTKALPWPFCKMSFAITVLNVARVMKWVLYNR